MSLRSVTVCGSLLFMSLALGGCYDLSDPSGPRPEDFQKNQTVGTAENDQTAATAEPDDDNCPDGTCNAAPVKVLSLAQPLEARSVGIGNAALGK